MTSDPTGPSLATQKILFARSGNRCAFPDCAIAMVEGEKVHGEVCHICAARSNGPRYDVNQSPSERHGQKNLILLCRNHHRKIDTDAITYTVERLHEMKAAHERLMAPLPDAEVDHAVRLLNDQSVVSFDQSGGITAHTVNQTIHVHPTPVADDRKALLKHARELHQTQIGKIKAGSTELKPQAGSLLVLHIVPLSSSDDDQSPAFAEISANSNNFPPIGDNHARRSKITYDGLFTGSNSDGLAKPQRAYVHVFQSGVVEAVAATPAYGIDREFLVLPELHANIIKYALDYVRSLAAAGVEPPFGFTASLVGVQSKSLLRDFIGSAFPEDIPGETLKMSDLQLGAVIIEAVPADYPECAKTVRSMLDRMSTAAALNTSPYFDVNGNYQLKIK